MRRSLLLLLCLAILLPSTGAADGEEDYHVRVTPHAFEAPSTGNGAAYDCAGPGPYGIADTVFYNAGEIVQGERHPDWMGVPYVGPECLAVDVRTPDPFSLLVADPVGCEPVEDALGDRVAHRGVVDVPPIPSPGGSASARGTYNLTSGQYYLRLGFPGLALAPETADGAAVEVSGNTGVSIEFDCRECEPPW